MQSVAKLAIAAAATLWPAGLASDPSGYTVLSKVTQMLEDMKDTATAALEEEKAAYDAFIEWCDSEKELLGQEITDQAGNNLTSWGNAQEADIEITRLTTAIADKQELLAEKQAELGTATARHKQEQENFLAELTICLEGTSSLTRAIDVLERRQSAAGSTLMQVADFEKLPSQARDLIAAFADMGEEDDAAAGKSTDPEDEFWSGEYVFKSGDIIGVLRDLLGKFQEKSSTTTQEKNTAQTTYDSEKQALESEITSLQQQIDEEVGLKKDQETARTAAERAQAAALELHAAGEEALSAVETECFQKNASYYDNKALREEELNALCASMNILLNETLQNVLNNSNLPPAGASLAQLSEASLRGGPAMDVGRRLKAFLTSEAQRLHSPGIEGLAQMAETDPFDKVKLLIRDLMTKLQNEAHEEMTHKGFCDKEMGLNELARNSLTAKIERLESETEIAQATIAVMAKQQAELNEEIIGLNSDLATAIEQREEEERVNGQTVKDAEMGATAVLEAIRLLKAYYAKALLPREEHSSPTLSKNSTERQPESASGLGDAYQGQQDEAGAVVAFLELIVSDFTSLKDETEASEETSAKAFVDYRHNNEKMRAVMEKKVSLLNADKGRTQTKFDDDTQDLSDARTNLETAETELTELQEDCVYYRDEAYTSSNRAAREAEIESLTHALCILKGEEDVVC